MVEFDRVKMTLANYEQPLLEIGEFTLTSPNKRDRVEELDKTMEDPGFWDDPEHSAKIVQESKKLKSVIERYESLESARDDILMLIEIAEEENDASVLEEVEDSLQQFEQEYESLRIETLLSGEYDKDNAILTLHAVPVEQKAATGQVCCAVCISALQKSMDLKLKCWIFWMVMKRVINQLRCRSMAQMRMVI